MDLAVQVSGPACSYVSLERFSAYKQAGGVLRISHHICFGTMGTPVKSRRQGGLQGTYLARTRTCVRNTEYIHVQFYASQRTTYTILSPMGQEKIVRRGHVKMDSRAAARASIRTNQSSRFALLVKI